MLTICPGSEPVSLYLYDIPSYIAQAIREAVYDGPIDRHDYDFQPVILEKLPSLQDGDAILEPVQVQEGDRVVDDQGDVLELSPGVRLRPAGCRYSGCAIDYQGESLEMDQLSVNFRLLPGVMWSDGEPLVASDSVFSYELSTHPDTPYKTGGSPHLKAGIAERTASYTALDERTIRWVGLPGYVDPQYKANFFTPLPRHQLEKFAPQELPQKFQGDLRLPLGWGPYRLTEWTPGVEIVAEKNPYYFRSAEGLPYFDGLVFRFTEQGQGLDDLQAKKCDVLLLDAVQPSQELIELEKAGALKIYRSMGNVWEHLDFNAQPASDYTGFAGRVKNADGTPIFANPEIRQAIAYCIDRQSLVNQATNGAGWIQNSYLPMDHPLYPADPDLPTYEFDPQRGLELLAGNGWSDSDGDGVLDNGGEKFSFVYSTRTNPMREQLTQLVKDQSMKNCMIEVQIELYGGEFFDEKEQGILLGRRYDVAGFAWLNDTLPPCQLFLSGEIPSDENGWKGQNTPGYANPDFDSACQAARQALPEQEDYRALHIAAQRIFAADLPVLPLFTRYALSASRPDLVGMEGDPSHGNDLWNIENFR